MNLLVLALVLAILAKPVAILKLGLKSISKRITGLIFFNFYTPPQHALTHNLLCFKIIDQANSKFDLKIKEALHIIWRKPNLNKCKTKSFSSHPFTIASVPLAPFCLCLFFFCSVLQFSFMYCLHYLYASYWHLLQA